MFASLVLACSAADPADGSGGTETSSGGAGGRPIVGVAGGGGSLPEQPPAIAPPGASEGEQPGLDGDNVVLAADGLDAVFRVESAPGEHVHFWLSFADEPELLELSVERWNGVGIDTLGTTDAGHGLRTLALFDAGEPRTYWARVHTDAAAFDGTLTVTRTPFADASTCVEDCERLLQLPLPIDAAVDGYATAPSTVFRYQFGRRDLVMLLRYAGRSMADSGHAPFVPEDLSQWDGETPGTDVGAPRHASHKRGRDVDVSLYGTDGLAPWRSYCETVNDGSGRECVPGTMHDLDGVANATMYAGFLESGRVTMSFLDAELIGPVVDGAELAAADGAIAASLLPLYGDGVHLQHWPNHDNHIHVRLSEGPSFQPEAVEPP
ncbi:MAG: hypothetical protein IT373_25505 [Polyangiaceae bacterium]|nr:hypothetical protein [Polyangiaceae bacterium]